MTPRSLRSTLLAGVASLSLTGVAVADGWSSIVVFGDRWADSGQFPSAEVIIGEETNPNGIGDGRQRATELSVNGGTETVYTQRISEALGFGALNPSQPATVPGAPPVAEGLNYAGLFNDSAAVLASINGGAYSPGSIRYLLSDGTPSPAAIAPIRPGLLLDPDRSAAAAGSLVLLSGGLADIRGLANVDMDFGNTPGQTEEGLDALEAIDIWGTYIETDPAARDFFAASAADNVVDGAAALLNAGAAQIIIPTMIDASQLPETLGDVGSLATAQNAFEHRLEQNVAALELTDARAALPAFEAQEASAERAATAAQDLRDLRQLQYDAALATYGGNTDPLAIQFITEAQTDLVAAQSAFVTAEQNSVNAALALAEAEARESEAESVLNGLVPRETESNGVTIRDSDGNAIPNRFTLSAAQEAELQERLAAVGAAIADPNLTAEIRQAATDAYNAQLLAGVQALGGNVFVVDYKSLLDAMIADPARFGFSPEYVHSSQCEFTNSLVECNEVGNAEDGELIFTDGLDPTAEAHQVLADYVLSFLNAGAAVAGTPSVVLNAARTVSHGGIDRVSPDDLETAGFAVFATGAVSGSNLDPRFRADLQEPRQGTGLVGVRYSTGAGLGFGAAVGYQGFQTRGGEAAIDYDGGALSGTVFAGMDRGGIFGNASLTYTAANLDATRNIRLNESLLTNTGETESRGWGATVEVATRLYSKDTIAFGPMARASYWSVTTDAYSEGGDPLTGITVHNDLESSSARASLGVFLEAGRFVEGRGVVFRGHALYGKEFADDTQDVLISSNAPNAFGTLSSPGRGSDDASIELGADLIFGLGNVMTSIGYDGLFGDNSTHSLRFGAALPL